MATFCRNVCRLTGRRLAGPDSCSPLLPNNTGVAAATAAAATRAARRGLAQIRSICRQCDELAPLVLEALATSTTGSAAGQVQLSAIRSRLEDLALALVEAQSEAEEASARARAGVREVVQCIAAAGSDSSAWCSGCMTLSDAGFEFKSVQGQAWSGDLQLVAWSDVARVGTREPEAGRQGGGLSGRMYEADLDLCRPPGRLRLQFGYAQPVRWLDALWKAARASRGRIAAPASPPPVPGIDAFGQELAESWTSTLSDFQRNGCRPTVELQQVHRVASLPCPGVTAANVREELERTDGDCALMRLWHGKSVTEFLHPSWAPMGGGLARCFSLRLPLKPIPMAPKSSRLLILYHLSGSAETTALAWISQSLDVPYASSFLLMGTFVFRQEGEGVAMEAHLGWLWRGRCMIKGIIQSQSRSETAEIGAELTGHICDILAPTPRAGSN